MKVLFISFHDIFGKLNYGGVQCAARNYALLAAAVGKESITACILTENPPDKEEKNVQYIKLDGSAAGKVLGFLQLRVFYTRKQEKKLREIIDSYQWDVVYFDTGLLGPLVKYTGSRARKLVFMHNIELNYVLNKIRHKTPLLALEYPAYRLCESSGVRYADKVICLNERDSLEMQGKYGRNADMLLPITMEDTFDPEKAESCFHQAHRDNNTYRLLFMGSLFAPNVDGLKWFVASVMPHMPKNVMLTVIGRGMEAFEAELGGPNVSVVGTVDDASTFFYGADAVVLPIRFGDGMKVKTAEAIMYGKTIFASKESLEGYCVKDVQEIVECNTPQEYVAAVDQAVKQKNSHAYHDSVRQLFKTRYETVSYIEALKDLLGK